jgi:hypothetical protein
MIGALALLAVGAIAVHLDESTMIEKRLAADTLARFVRALDAIEPTRLDDDHARCGGSPACLSAIAHRTGEARTVILVSLVGGVTSTLVIAHAFDLESGEHRRAQATLSEEPGNARAADDALRVLVASVAPPRRAAPPAPPREVELPRTGSVQAPVERSGRLVPWLLVAGAAAALAAGGGFEIAGWSARKSAGAEIGFVGPRFDAQLAEASRNRQIAIGLTLTAGVALVAGTLWFLLGVASPDQSS